jgi:hypothetical protein
MKDKRLCIQLLVLTFGGASTTHAQTVTVQVAKFCEAVANYANEAARNRDLGVSRADALKIARATAPNSPIPKEAMLKTATVIINNVYDHPKESAEDLTRDTFDDCLTEKQSP